MRPSLSDLSTFTAVAKHQSFRAASVELGVSPSAVSHSLRQLEEHLSLRLVNRTTRSVSLTEAGRRLYNSLAPAMVDIQRAVDDLSPLRDTPTGTLRITAARQAARLFLMDIATDFVQQYPGMKVEIMADDKLADVVGEGFDAGVRLGERVGELMIATPIGPRVRFAVAATPEYFARHPAPLHPRDLLRHQCVVFRFPSKENVYHWEFERAGEQIEIEVNGDIAVNDMDLALDAVLKGAGIGFFHIEQINTLAETGQLALVLEDWLTDRSGFYLYYPSRQHLSHGFRLFLDFIKQRQREH
ncbi:LysR substrate-binding domain-containing protein [Pseudomonas sp. 7P_10.2_Bac1]|uniref:LysR family transcriptional regulator n=1 Tax=Pseudomonas sp. 7P_10.2_Bac1 TaxID=2971614 RepID=UPI0021C689C2|nr:LysR family transcriptional regulator [Pseudomonas sp. 7P_10.2_Bac1]MCU1727677.1 LysR substrate-binding domain-containing protein [Pseudomonas sp. 7P_10.2_Bac1]